MGFEKSAYRFSRCVLPGLSHINREADKNLVQPGKITLR